MTTLSSSVYDLNQFLDGLDGNARRAVIGLSVAEGLTDDLAVNLAQITGLSEKQAKKLVAALHFTDFIIERNSEWNFADRCQSFMFEELQSDKDLFIKMHENLTNFAITANQRQSKIQIPSYLASVTGIAIHQSVISHESGLKLYAQVAQEGLSGTQWLLGIIAIRQQEQKLLPPEAIEPPYIRGITLYKEGHLKESEIFLRKVTSSQQVRFEVAIACHLVGRMDTRDSHSWKRAEDLLWRSLHLGEELHERLHQAMVLHTLGQFIGKDRSRQKQAEELLWTSLHILEDIHDKHGEGMVLHTLGQFIGKDRSRQKQAEELLWTSLHISEDIHDKHGEGMVLHTLGQFIGNDKSRQKQAEELLWSSLHLLEDVSDRRGEAMVLHTLGQLIISNPLRRKDGEDLLRRSLHLGPEYRHQAMVLYTLGKLIGEDKSRFNEAEKMLSESLQIEKDLHNKRGEAMVHHALDELRKKHNPKKL